MEELFTAALGLSSPWRVSGIDFHADEKRLDIRLSFAKGSRFDIDGVACPVHDTVEKEWRHLNFFEHECYVRAKIARVRTPDGRTLRVTHLHAWISWVKTCGLKSMEKAVHAVVRHIDGILSWKQSQLNNGILEGLNSVIQAAKRKARRYKPKHFKTMVYCLTGKLDLQKINPYY